MLKILETELKEVKILEYTCKEDNRGLTFSTYSEKVLLENGIDIHFTEQNIYCPIKSGTLYGIHFQNNPAAQTKLLYCIAGRGIDYAVDLRRDSPTYLKWISVELSKENRRQIFIPKGFGHAFVSLEDNTQVVMWIDEYFDKKYSRQIAWNDSQIAIQYPIENPILAQHDIDAPKLSDSDCNL
ncbi:MAG: dTDP-4-dehydrorhamnose 3,5-epimerase [Cellulosilyticum sp.]|nr:dTDP-4-dehydrorhamnose 3,5-epimerase [Cellulosilyticum sp.]